jgi:hypothetical protein
MHGAERICSDTERGRWVGGTEARDVAPRRGSIGPPGSVRARHGGAGTIAADHCGFRMWETSFVRLRPPQASGPPAYHIRATLHIAAARVRVRNGGDGRPGRDTGPPILGRWGRLVASVRRGRLVVRRIPAGHTRIPNGGTSTWNTAGKDEHQVEIVAGLIWISFSPEMASHTEGRRVNSPRSVVIIALTWPLRVGAAAFFRPRMATYWIEFDGIGDFQVWTRAGEKAPPHVCVTFPRYGDARDWINARPDAKKTDPA